MANHHAPLAYNASADSSSPSVSPSLPSEVVTCLKNARFLHLATCHAQTPHVSLMNYTYLPSTPFSPSPSIIMTTNPVSKKTSNLRTNPRVSLLVHDWVSHRPPTRAADPSREGSPPPSATRSSLASMLLNMNTSALSRISATINGEARIVAGDSEEAKWCKKAHLDNNTFGDQSESGSELLSSSPGYVAGDGGRGCFIEGEEVQVVVVRIEDGRIADWKGSVQDWTISDISGRPPTASDSSMVNGA
ncbi:MAG: hypothetical protein M1828_001701 [Chrysothrix sp. TS-e1954]|nr:MAG: hypothetical protein M1828_001701 [Chrysothrix sp. TS-e1954]